MNKTSVFKSEKGRMAIMEWYDSQVQKLPVTTESSMVETFAGKTHVLTAGPQEAPPIVLLHGTNMNAVAMADAMIALAETYRIYALDIIGMPGKSAETRLSHVSNGYARWLLEVLDQLKLQQANFLGFSFGGWIILKLAAHFPTRISKAVLLDSGGFTQFTMRGKVKGGLAAFWYMLFPTEKNLERAVIGPFYALGCDPDPDLAELFGLGYLHLTFNKELVIHGVPPLSKKDLAGFSAPTMVVYGEHDMFFDARKSIAQAKQILPNLVEAEIIEGQGHMPNKETHNQIFRRVREFLGKV
jgi:2-hydroxy-6-oxonona-2,4-dienedioate hydrolase